MDFISSPHTKNSKICYNQLLKRQQKTFYQTVKKPEDTLEFSVKKWKEACSFITASESEWDWLLELTRVEVDIIHSRTREISRVRFYVTEHNGKIPILNRYTSLDEN